MKANRIMTNMCKQKQIKVTKADQSNTIQSAA